MGDYSARNVQSVAQHEFPIATGSFDQGNRYYKYLGPPLGEVKPSPYDKVQYTNYDLPEYYKGKNLFLRDTIDGLIMDDSSKWYTTNALPWTATDQIHVKWNEWHFSSVLAGRVPHEGISRLITSSKKEFKDHVVRRGLAFVMEAEYFGTPEGDVQYQQNVKSIAKSVQHTSNHDTVYALLTSKNYFKMWEETFGTREVSYLKVLEDEIYNYALLVKDEYQMEIIIAQHTRIMNKVGVSPDMIIFPPGTRIYYSMALPERRTKYLTAGPEGQAMFKAGPKSLAVLHGLNVFETMDFTVYEDSPPIDLLTRSSTISEFNTMLFEASRNEELTNYLTKSRTIVVYNQNRDAHEKVTFETAFLRSYIFDKDGKYHRDLVGLVEKYEKEDRRPKSGYDDDYDDDDDNYGDDDDYGNQMKFLKQGSDPPSFFLAATDSDQKYFLINYFGQMDMKYATARDVEQVGQSVVSHIFGGSLWPADGGDTWQDMIRLIKEIEDQDYNHEYWRALIEANLPQSLDKATFVGKLTPSDLSDTWSESTRITEWKSNNSGSLVLPQDKSSLSGVEYPAGFANGPGLQTLAKESTKPKSHWYEIGKRAADAVDLVQRMVSHLKLYFPTSQVLLPKNRSPWFHLPDAVTVFFESIISTRRHPIFIAALPPVMTGTGANRRPEGRTFGKEDGEDDKTISWFTVPLFFVPDISDPGLARPLVIQEIIQALTKLYNGKIPQEIQAIIQRINPSDEGFIYPSPIAGTNLHIPGSHLLSPTMITRDMRIMMLMGESSLKELITIFETINKDENYPTTLTTEERTEEKRNLRNKFLAFAFNYVSSKGNTKHNLRRIVLALSEEGHQDPQILFDIIKTIYIDKNSPKKVQDQALRKIEELKSRKLAHPDDDPKQDPFKQQSTPLQPPAFRSLGDRDIAQEGFLNFSGDVAEKMEEIQELISDITSLAYSITTTFKSELLVFSFLTPDKWIDGVNSAVLGSPITVPTEAVAFQSYNMLMKKEAQLRKLVADLNLMLRDASGDNTKNMDAWNEEAVERQKKGTGSLRVQDDERAVFRSKFYRSPLTMSLSLLESLSREGPTALIRPSDPRTAHTSEYLWEPGELDRLPDEIWKVPEYSSITSLHFDKKRELDQLGFISKHVKTGVPQDPNNNSKKSGRSSSSRATTTTTTTTTSSFVPGKRKTAFEDFGDNDDDSQDEDALSRAFENDDDDYPYGREKFRKTQFDFGGRSENMPISSPMMTEEEGWDRKKGQPQEGWTRSTLKKGYKGARKFFGGAGQTYSPEFKKIKTPAFVHRWKQSNMIANPFVRACVQVFLSSKSTGDQWLTMINNDIHVLVNFILWRLFIEHDMSSAIIMKGGIETGGNVYGHSNFATGNDIVSKIVYGNYTFYSKAMVWREKNVHIIENIRPMGYKGGYNTAFLTRKKDLNRRDVNRPSFIATAIPITENNLPKDMSFTGTLQIQDWNELIDGKVPISYSTFEYYEDIVWKLSRHIKSSDMGRDSFFDKENRLNVHARQGWQANFTRALGYYGTEIQGNGHRKGLSYPGVAKVWEGKDKFFEKYQFSTTKID